MSNKEKDYSVHGTLAEKIFNAFGAIAAILVCNTTGLLPEMQVILVTSTVMSLALLNIMHLWSLTLKTQCNSRYP